LSVKQVPRSVKQVSKEHNLAATVLLSALGYAVVIATFAGALPYPDVGLDTVNLMAHAIAVVNTATLLCILAGWRWIRRGEVRKHRAAMVSAFSLIILFLLIYLFKVGGGGTKEFVGPTLVRNYLYLPMLAVHLVLSIVSVPVVIYAVVLGLTHTPEELRETPHARIGRIAAGAWSLSLFLGVIAYILLNHVYSWDYLGLVLPW
jgi:putative membrane protein